MFDYQSSIYVVNARKRYREIDNEVKILNLNKDNLTIGNKFNGDGEQKIYNMQKRISKEGIFKNYNLIDGKEYVYEGEKLVRVNYFEKGIIVKIEKYVNGQYIGNEPLPMD